MQSIVGGSTFVMGGLKSSGKRCASQSTPISSVDSGAGTGTSVGDSKMKTGVEATSSFSLYPKKDGLLGLGFGYGSQSPMEMKRYLFLSLLALQIPAWLRNGDSNEAEGAITVDRNTGLPLVPLLITERRRALTMPNENTTPIGRGQMRRLLRLGQELRNIGDELDREATARRESLAAVNFFSRARSNTTAENRRRR